MLKYRYNNNKNIYIKTKGKRASKVLREYSDHVGEVSCLLRSKRLPWPYGLSLDWRRLFLWRLKDRFNEHRRTIDNPNTKSKPTTAAEHFLTAPNHTANDMQLIPIEKVFSNRDSVRKAREAFLISKGRTLLPHGLNIREEPY